MRMLYVCVIIHIWLSIEKGLKCHWERHPLLVLSRASNEIVSSGKYLWKINKKRLFGFSGMCGQNPCPIALGNSRSAT